MRALPSVSYVVPCWNDAAALESCLEGLAGLQPAPQRIVSDASRARDPIRRLCRRYGAELVEVEEPNRGQQLNAGAARATGGIVAFLHADTVLTQEHHDSIAAAFAADPLLGGGCFFKDIAFAYPRLGMLEGLYRVYARHLGILYGELCMFVERELFEQMGGFDPLPLMEDVAFSGRLRDAAPVRWLVPPIRPSQRKFERDGALKRWCRNAWLTFLFRMGVPPERLRQRYYGPDPAGPPA